MQSKEIRERYLKFFEKRGHKIIPSASLVPANYVIPDKGTLFTTAGMQPLVPYLLGEKHPGGTRLVDVQKCVRTGDIDDVGDNRHCTFFEMMGNWSLGDYFKKESIAWSLEFLTDKNEGLGLDPKRLYVTIFKGEDGIPRDDDSVTFWQENFKKHNLDADVAGEDEIIGELPCLPPTPSQGGGERPGYCTADPSMWKLLQEKALEMRQHPTDSEDKLWQILRKDKQYNFRRQHVVDKFIADFVCLSRNLIIEIDGDIHDLQKERDEERTTILSTLGFQIIRFRNEEVLRDVESVYKSIIDKASGLKALPLGEGLGEASKDIRIIPLGKDDNFWIAGATGPCGGDTEIFYDVFGEEKSGKLAGKFYELTKSGRIIEIWNNVFMEFNKTADGKYEPLAKKNVDTGMGLERTATVMQGKANVFETDIFEPLISFIRAQAKSYDEKFARIVADHVRSAVFIISDGVIPSNTEAGYVLRRVLRRAIRFIDKLGLSSEAIFTLAKIVIADFSYAYPDLKENESRILEVIKNENERFRQTLENGLKEFEKGTDAFDLFQTYGFPIEVTVELAREKGINIDVAMFNEKMKKHQEISKAGSEQKFKGGLAGTGEIETKYHTATHLLLASLRKILGGEIVQKGSNITTERMRFDFNWPEKLSAEQIKAVEDLVNQKIQEKLPVTMVEMPKEEAKKVVTTLSFDLSKYGDVVKVYKIGPSSDSGSERPFSAEFCGGPHVMNTGDLASVHDPEGNPKGNFKIIKEEAVSVGVRRIKAVLE